MSGEDNKHTAEKKRPGKSTVQRTRTNARKSTAPYSQAPARKASRSAAAAAAAKGTSATSGGSSRKKERTTYKSSKKAKLSSIFSADAQAEDTTVLHQWNKLLEARKQWWRTMRNEQMQLAADVLKRSACPLDADDGQPPKSNNAATSVAISQGKHVPTEKRERKEKKSTKDTSTGSGGEIGSRAKTIGSSTCMRAYSEIWSYCDRWERLLHRFYDMKEIHLQRTELDLVRRLLDSDPDATFLVLEHYHDFCDLLLTCASPYMREIYPTQQVMSEYILQSGPVMDRTLDGVMRWQLEPESDLPEFHQKDTCTRCKAPLVLYKRHSLLVCTCNGSASDYFNATSSALDYGRNAHYQTNEYNRKKFFEKYMLQYRILNNPITEDLIISVKTVLYEWNIGAPQNVRMDKIRKVLEHLNKKPYTLYAKRILDILLGNVVAYFDEQQYRMVGECYNEVEKAFLQLRSCVPQRLKRVNFPNFPFFLHKVCILKGWTVLKQCFPVQSVQNSLKDQEDDWKVFVERLVELGSKELWEITLSR
jgi:hypothetical protein